MDKKLAAWLNGKDPCFLATIGDGSGTTGTLYLTFDGIKEYVNKDFHEKDVAVAVYRINVSGKEKSKMKKAGWSLDDLTENCFSGNIGKRTPLVLATKDMTVEAVSVFGDVYKRYSRAEIVKMLCALTCESPSTKKKKFYLVTIDMVVDCEPKANPPILTESKSLAKRKFEEIKQKIENYGFPNVKEEDYETNDEGDFFEVFETSNWCRNHYSVEMTVVYPE